MNIDTDIFRIETNHVLPQRGCVLISEPFLQDYFFGRSVIFLVEHSVEGGTMGLVLNKPLPLWLGDLVSGCEKAGEIPVYRGGPLAMDTLFYLHTLDTLNGSLLISDGIYLNGDFEAIKRYISQGNPVRGRIRFFLGYSGWEHGQLREECEENTWLVSHEGRACLRDDTDCQWENALSHLGYKYSLWSRFPQIPMLN